MLIDSFHLREEGSVLQNNGLSVKILPRFKGFMVDHFGSQFSDSAVFWHGDKDTNILQQYWKVEENNTFGRSIFPQCQLKH